MTETHTTIQPIHNHTTELVHGFLVGHNYMEKLSETVFDTFEPDSEVRYMDTCVTAKQIMMQNEPKILDNSIFFIPHYEEIPAATVVALVRYVNLAHKGKYFIVAGEKVLYVPEHLKTINEQNIKLFVELTILEDRNKGDSKIINKFRSWLYGMKLSFSLVH